MSSRRGTGSYTPTAAQFNVWRSVSTKNSDLSTFHVATVTICGYVQAGTRFSTDKIAEVIFQLYRQPEKKWDREFVYQ